MKLRQPASINSLLIILLLISQIILSGIIIANIQQLNTFFISNTQDNIPQYIPEVSRDDDPSKGSTDAPITVIAFIDYECPSCSATVNYSDIILDEYKDKVLWVIRDFPLEAIHPNAFQAALAANCANEQGKFWEMHQILFENQQSLSNEDLKQYASDIGLDAQLFDECLDTEKYQSEVKNDIAEGLSYQISATPTFFVNGNRIIGGSIEQLRSTIDSILNSGKEN